MSRDSKLYLKDILNSIHQIEIYIKGKTYDEFSKNQLLIDGVVRNLEIIGEATKNIPSSVQKEYPSIEWKKIAGLRDILSHAYFGVSLPIIWDIVTNKVPELKRVVRIILKDLK